MMLALLLCIFSVAVGIHVTFTSPTPMAPKERRVAHEILTVVMMLAAEVFKYSCWIHCLIEMLILALLDVARRLPTYPIIQWMNDTFLEVFLPSSSFGNDKTIFFPPLRIFGAFLIMSGSTLRYMCFRELGRQFTFHLALLEKHTLVTSGPYSIVRHPSYTAVVIVNTGIVLWHLTPGSWLRQSRLYMSIIVWVAVFLPAVVIIGGTILLGILFRPRIEDEMLKKEFGKKWDEWAKRVPYRIFPGIY